MLTAFYALADLDRLTVDVRDQGRGVDVRGVVDPCEGAGFWDGVQGPLGCGALVAVMSILLVQLHEDPVGEAGEVPVLVLSP